VQARVVDQPLESVQIDVVRFDPKDVTRGSGDDHVRGKRLPQPGDIQPERGVGRPGRVHAPERIDQLISRHNLIGMQQQHRQKRAGPEPAHLERAMLAPDLEWSQDPELEQARTVAAP